MSLTDRLRDDGNAPAEFEASDLIGYESLFRERSALFFTPTASIPSTFVGEGPLRVTLPVPSPTFDAFQNIRAYGIPRLWVDLLQRSTRKLRWTPMDQAAVQITVYDTVANSVHDLFGAKSLIDALKEHTWGRPDGRLLHYFGAIQDDSPRHISLDFDWHVVDDPVLARTEIKVDPLARRRTTLAHAP